MIIIIREVRIFFFIFLKISFISITVIIRLFFIFISCAVLRYPSIINTFLFVIVGISLCLLIGLFIINLIVFCHSIIINRILLSLSLISIRIVKVMNCCKISIIYCGSFRQIYRIIDHHLSDLLGFLIALVNLSIMENYDIDCLW